MRHVVIGTAGHVDHGKTTLVEALTGVATDRLPEEQRRGITIELGFAPWRLNDELSASMIDAPGHRKLVHHMVAGASGIDLVLLIVAADEGVMPQTREHIAACRLLAVQRAAVAITKMDRGDPELAELAAEETRELLTEAGFEEPEVAFCSAKTGEGVDEVRAAVVRAIERVKPPSRARRTRLSIDRIFTVHGAGTVVTGTLVEGRLKTGTDIRIIGDGTELSSSARGLQVHGGERKLVAAPSRVAV
ncbi:MAG: selenocysteine-specific translation elongation factor, partial [Myxococcota bacterium]